MSTSLKMCKPKCAVCGASNATKNRGGITCISCRSFFVRYVRTVKPLNCINGGDCVIATDKETSWCKVCRYQRCLEAGMSIELVPHYRKKDGTYTKFGESLIQRHVVPAISLGYKFVGEANVPMNAIKCAKFYSSIDKLTISRSVLSENLRQFSLQVPLAYSLLDSNCCFSRNEYMDALPANAGSILIPYKFAQTLADVIDFVTAIPEFVSLALRDQLRLMQNNFSTMAVLRNSIEYYWYPSPSELEETLIKQLQLMTLSEYTTQRLQMFQLFMIEHAVPTFKKTQITKEEVALLHLIACFSPCMDCSEKGRLIINQARNKYINILKSYHQEKYPDMSDEEKVERFRQLLNFIGRLQDLSLALNSCLSAQVLNNGDLMLGQLSHDLHVHVYTD